MSLADSKHFLHFVHALVQDPDHGIQGISRAHNIPKTSAYRLGQFFRFHNALGRRNVDPRRVLRLAADLRKDRAVPDLTIRTDDAYKVLNDIEELGHHLAFASAANAIAQFEPAETSIRIHAKSATELTFLKKHNDPSGRSEFHFYADDLSRYPAPIQVEAALVCDPIITLADLYSHPRAGAHAEFLDRTLTRAGRLPPRP